MAILWQRKLFIHEYLNILLSIFSTFCPESDNVPTEKSIQGLGGNLIGNQISIGQISLLYRQNQIPIGKSMTVWV